MKAPYLFLSGLAVVFAAAFVRDQPVRIPDTPEQVTVTYWEKWTGFEGEAMRATIDLFNKKKIKNKSGQTIFCKILPATQNDRKTLLAVAGGHPPDISGLWMRNLNVYADLGALRPLDDLIERDRAEVKPERYVPVYWNGCKYRDRMFALPTTPATVALHWNKDLFKAAGLDPDRPPKTLKEIEEFSEKLIKRDETGRIVQMGFLPPEPGWWHWAWGYYWGGKLADGPDTITTDDPKNVEAFEWLCSFGEKYGRKEGYAFHQATQKIFDSPLNAFMSGKVGMVLQGVWMANFIRFNNPQMNWGVAPFPSGCDNGGQPHSITDMDIVVIPVGCPHVEEAWTVLKFINSYEGMEFLCGGKENNGGQGKQTPFYDSTPGWVEEHPHPYLSMFIELGKSKNAFTLPKLPMWQEYEDDMRNAFQRMWLNDPPTTPKEVLHELKVRMQAKLDRIRAVQKLREADQPAKR